MNDMDDDALLDALEVPDQRKVAGAHTALEERVIAGFEDIVNFVKQHDRTPQHGEERDIFERLYAVRLDRLRTQPQFHALLAPYDAFRLLSGAEPSIELEDDDALLAELEVECGAPDSLTDLKHVRPRAEINAADDIARREVCKEFERFKPLFERVQGELDQGLRESRRFQRDADIRQGDYFILGGQKAYVAEIGEEFRTDQERRNARLRVIFDNGTESRGLLRSFQRALYKDEGGRRITDPVAGPLFAQKELVDGEESGTIYVLRSKSDHPQIAPHREILHKIGVTGGEVGKRVGAAAMETTFLHAGVDVIATYKLYNISRTKLESLIHRIFASARMDVEIKDPVSGKAIRPREWFFVPLPVIDEAVERIRDRSIIGFEFDPKTAALKRI